MKAIALVDVYMTTAGHLRKATEEAIVTLYELLKERDATINISHKSMPSLAQHKSFLASEPYLEWFLIRAERQEGDPLHVGSIYVSRNSEVGIFIFKQYQGQGFGSAALNTIKARYPKMRLLANINPKNEASRAFFAQHGFKLMQETYELAR